MQAHIINIWDKFNLYCAKAVILVVFLVCIKAVAQPPPQESYKRSKKKVDINLPNYDDRFLHYGFFLAVNYNRLQINVSDDFINSTTLKSVTPIGAVDFNLGFLLNIRIADQLAFKILPSVGFYDRNLIFTYTKPFGDIGDGNDTMDLKVIETTFIETSFLLKYKSIRRQNHRFYLVGGIKPAIRAGGKVPDAVNKNMGIGRFDLTVEYGFGLDLYFPYFKFAPELRFSHGLINMNSNDNNIYNNSILNMYTHTVTLYFFFE